MPHLRPRIVIALAAAASVLSLVLGFADTVLEGEGFALGPLLVDAAEKLILVGAMFASAFVVLRLSRLEEETSTLRADMAGALAEGEEWRSRSKTLIHDLSEAISSQFADWGLTPAEADIAGLMLKGLSQKEIAGLRKTSQTTIRQQAQSIYRKSGLSGRAELSAYFLEDLFDRAIGEGNAELSRQGVIRPVPQSA